MGWPTVPVGPRQRGFPGQGTFDAETQKGPDKLEEAATVAWTVGRPPFAPGALCLESFMPLRPLPPSAGAKSPPMSLVGLEPAALTFPFLPLPRPLACAASVPSVPAHRAPARRADDSQQRPAKGLSAERKRGPGLTAKGTEWEGQKRSVLVSSGGRPRFPHSLPSLRTSGAGRRHWGPGAQGHLPGYLCPGQPAA